MTAYASVEDVELGLTSARLSVVKSEFEQQSADLEPDREGAIEVEGRIRPDVDRRSLTVDLRLRHTASTVRGSIATSLRYEWDNTCPSAEQMIEFARTYGVQSALPATAALFNEGFLKFGVRISFPPPRMADQVAGTLADAALRGE